MSDFAWNIFYAGQCDPPLDNHDEDIVDNVESKDSADELEEEIEIDMGDGIGEEREDGINSESDESEGEENDIIIVDKGEELDEEIWAQKGHGPL